MEFVNVLVSVRGRLGVLPYSSLNHQNQPVTVGGVLSIICLFDHHTFADTLNDYSAYNADWQTSRNGGHYGAGKYIARPGSYISH